MGEIPRLSAAICPIHLPRLVNRIIIAKKTRIIVRRTSIHRDILLEKS